MEAGVNFQVLQTTLAQVPNAQVGSVIVNAPFDQRLSTVMMGLGIIVLLIKGNKTGLIHRVALSNNDLAEGTKKLSVKKFEEIKIPSDNPKNIIAEAIRSQSPQMTNDWSYLFTPALSPRFARLNQAGGAIACSYVYPIRFADNDGALIFSYYREAGQLPEVVGSFMSEYSQIVANKLKLCVGELKSYLND